MFGKGKKEPQTTAAISLQKEDDLGKYPNDVDSSPSQSRANERALRAVSLVAIVAGMMCIALTMLIISILPLQKVYPYLVTFSKHDDQVVSIEPLAANAPGILYATEDGVRDYINQRHSFTPSQSIMNAQWGPNSKLAARTAQDVYAKFADASKDEMTRMMTLGYARTISITAVNRIANDTWQVDFVTHDQLPTSGGTLTPAAVMLTPTAQPTPAAAPAAGTTAAGPATGFAAPAPVPPVAATTNGNSVSDQSWVATMRVGFEPQKVTYDKRLLNPLGFTVTDYSVTRSTR